MQRVFVFPGQGSQSVGMLAELAARSPIIQHTFAEGSEALGLDLWQLVQEGPSEQLNQTANTQPAMLAAGVATWRYWVEHGGFRPDAVAGHSLGEFTALVVARALEFATAMRLVRTRGQLMQDAVPANVGAIAAVLGLEDGKIAEACVEAARGEVVELVNFNSSGQVVIAGHVGAVQRALDGCTQRGARRAVLLPMSVPAHSSLMGPAAARFAEHLATTELKIPQAAFWSPVDSAPHAEVEDIRSLLVRQLSSPVHWKELVRVLAEAGTRMFIECGPGKVLTGLNKRAERRRELVCIALEDPAAVDEALMLLPNLQTGTES